MNEWYRRKKWEKSDEQEFFAKLNKARANKRGQYLKIQAIELIETKSLPLLEIAEQLLNRVLNEYPDDKFNRGQCFYSLGEIYLFRKDLDRALQYYKMAVDYELEYPGLQTNAYLVYTELIIKTGKYELFALAENILSKKLPRLLFPIEKYKVCSILSVINSHNKNHQQAKYFAELADDNANKIISGLRYHAMLGLVEKRDEVLDKLVLQGLTFGPDATN